MAASILKRKMRAQGLTVPFECACGFGAGTSEALARHRATCSRCPDELPREASPGARGAAAARRGGSPAEEDVLLLPVFEGPVAACAGHTDSPGWLAASDAKLSSRVRGAESENVSPSAPAGGKLRAGSRLRPTASASPLQPSAQNRAVGS